MVSALENAILAAGAKDYEAGMAQASKLIAFLHNSVQMMQTKDAFRKTLDSCSEVSKSEEKIALMGLTMMPICSGSVSRWRRKRPKTLFRHYLADAHARSLPPKPERFLDSYQVCMKREPVSKPPRNARQGDTVLACGQSSASGPSE